MRVETHTIPRAAIQAAIDEADMRRHGMIVNLKRYGELKRVCDGADEEFLMDQLLVGTSDNEAAQDWIARLQRQLKILERNLQQ
ncbi:MAG: hypothetical protein SGI88_02115 [Candidatus Hydrogenedentes bacterium]|nr:hypothetical protein [Candidatus Hydrogenedentota bacterium]